MESSDRDQTFGTPVSRKAQTPNRSLNDSGLILQEDPLTPGSRRMLENTMSTMDTPLSPTSMLSSTIASLGQFDSRCGLNNREPRSVKERSFDFSASTSQYNTAVLNTREFSHDRSVIKYGDKIRLRFSNCQYLRVMTSHESPDLKTTFQSHAKTTYSRTKVVYSVQADGQGFNNDDEDDVFVLIHANHRNDEGDVKYGDTVALHNPSGMGRYLSTDIDKKSVTTKARSTIGNAEKWKIINPSVYTKDSTSLLCSEHSSSASLCIGDRVAFVSCLIGAHLVKTPDAMGLNSISLMAVDDARIRGANAWELLKQCTPYLPSWNRSRVYLTGEHLGRYQRTKEGMNDDNDQVPLSKYPVSLQEKLMVEDLLYCMLGIEGKYIRVKNPRDASNWSSTTCTTEFYVDASGLDSSISSLTSRVLPICQHYVSIKRYIETRSRYEFGQVVHAFCAALKSLLKEYTIVVAQLEHQVEMGELSLQKLWFYTQPSMRTMEILSKVTEACADAHGGKLLTAIQKTASFVGDSNARDIFSFLMKKASAPFFKMLCLWIYQGAVDDPFDEFMIHEDKRHEKEELMEDPWSKFWEKRFTLQDEQVPVFLKRYGDKILTTGKYLNIYQSSQQDMLRSPSNGMALEYMETDRVYEDKINEAHGWASKLVLDLVVVENCLVNRLQSMKHYFLMDQGDFFVDFMAIAETELYGRATDVSLARLESLLQISLQSSTCSSDPYRDDLTCLLSPYNLISQMERIHSRAGKALGAPATQASFKAGGSLNDPGYKAIDAFTLNYRIQWPLSLVISAGYIQKYQMLFRHLFFCKHVERRLCNTWMTQQMTKEFDLKKELGPSYCLRQRMLHFQQNFVYYMMFEVISPHWHEFQEKLREVTNIDEIIGLHKDFLDSCLKECLLTDSELIGILTSLMTACTQYANSVELLSKPYVVDDETLASEREDEREKRAQDQVQAEAEEALAKLKSVTKKPVLLRRASSSTVNLRRERIKEMSDNIRKDLTNREDSALLRRTAKATQEFNALLSDFMQKLLHRSHLQYNSHLSNLCTRLDYNGFYTKA